jgi:ABC-type ATPase with predicted acetyltransferase domain
MTPSLAPGKLADWHPESGAIETLVTRRIAPGEPEKAGARFSLLDSMIVSRGARDDWNLLHELHYKSEGLPIGAHYWKCTLEGQTIGVLVMGQPKGLLKERHVALPKFKPHTADSKITNTKRYQFINAHFRVIGRFVFDTMYRGVGAGYRMMNLVARMEGMRFIEIQSSMSKFNLFGQKAGFRFVKPMNSIVYHLGLVFFRENFEANMQDFEAICAEIEAAPEGVRARILEEARAFYARHSHLEKTGIHTGKGRERIDAMSHRALIKNIQQMVLASPMYGIYVNPDWGRKLPDSLPLTAFDNQAPNEPLKL